MKKNESGRSMVEMLGVLAIIGVLSVGGIAGYTMAMNRYRANEVVDYANKYAVIVYSGWMTAKMMNNGTVPTDYANPTFAQTGLFGSKTTVNGTAIALASTDPIGEGGVKVVLTFGTDAKKTCQATATSLGIAPNSNTAGADNWSQGKCEDTTAPTINYFFKQS